MDIGPAEGYPFFGPCQGPPKSGVIERLQQVVQGPGLKSPKGVMVVGGHEDDSRRQVSTKHLEHVKAVALGHLHVEED